MRLTKSGVAAVAIGLSFAAYCVTDYTRHAKLLESIKAAHQDLADISRIGTNAIGATGEKASSHQLELAEERAKLDERGTELADAQREIQRTREMHAATDASYAATLETQRLKVTSLESDLAKVRSLNAALQEGAKQAALKQTDLLAGKELAEAALKKTTEALDLERERSAAATEKASAELERSKRDFETSKAETAATIEQQRVHIEALQHDIAAAAQFVAEADARAKSSESVNLVAAKEVAEAAAKQAGEALDRERVRAIALANELETARREQALAQEELARVSAASKEALEQETAKAASLSLQLASARKDIQAFTRRLNRYASNASERSSAAKAVKADLPAAITLPDALRPTRPAADVLIKNPIER